MPIPVAAMSSSSVEGFVRQPQSAEPMSLPYYHPDLYSMEDVRAVMVQYIMQDGYFLLRNSISRPGILTVTVMHTNSIKHFNIGSTNSTYFLQDKHFNTLSELVNYYKNHDVPNVEGVEHVRLIRPIPHNPRPSPVISRSQSEVGTVSSQPPDLRRLHNNRSFDSSATSVSSGGTRIVEIPTDIGPGNGPSRHTLHVATIPDPNMPRLPEAPPAKKSHPLMKVFKKKSSSGSDSSKRPSVEDRPPMPIPGSEQGAAGEKTYVHYDTVRDIEADQSKDLIYHLKKSERFGEMCECGLSLEDSELPMEWSMHISREAPTEGRIFFMGPSDQTVWELPFEVTLQLTPEQQRRISTLRQGYVANHSGLSGASGGGSGSGSSGNRRSAPVFTVGNGQVNSGNGFVGGQQQRRGQSLMHDSGAMTLPRQPQQHECHAGEDDVFH